MIKNKKNILKITSISLLTLAVATGCSVSSKKTVNVSEPISTIKTVMGDVEVEKVVSEDKIPRSMAVMPLINDTDEDIASQLLRSVIQNHFSSKNFQLMNWQEVDRQLAFASNPADVDPQKAIQQLGVDAVLVGHVTEFNLLHAGIYAEISMTVDLKLINSSGEAIWTANENVTTRAGGISTTPWGLLLNAATATMHLSEKNMLAAADDLGRVLAKKIPQPSGYQGSTGPTIDYVLHDGGGKALNYGTTLHLGLRGEPGQRASISIDGVQSYELPEMEPGVYVKTIPVSASWNNEGAMVIGRLTDKMGTITTLISSTGLVKFDNIAPAPVSNVKLSTGENNNTVSWSVTDSDSVKYRVYSVKDDRRTLLGESDVNSLSLENMPMFASVRLEVDALDSAGNASNPAVINTKIYPVAGVENATTANSAIDINTSGSILLSAAKSPYTLSGRLHIAEGEQLFVEPGVELMMTQGGSLDIEGDAWFWGQDNTIKIAAKANQAPSEFIKLHSKGSVQLNNVSIENGNIGVSIEAGAPQFNGVSFVNNQYNAVLISGSSAPNFNQCHFEGSLTAGVVISDYAKPIFKDSMFKNNRPFHIQSSAVYPANAEGNRWEPAASTSSILGDVRY